VKKVIFVFAIITLAILTVIVFCSMALCTNKKKVAVTENKEKKQPKMKQQKPALTLTTVYDNYSVNPDLETDWGFSCLIEYGEKTILFDTGAKGQILLENMQKLNIEPQNIKSVFISHQHNDHTGGLNSLLQNNSNINVSYPESGWKEISPNIYTTGALGTFTKEQSLVIQTNKGAVIITGCAHPGIINIIKNVKQNLNSNIYLVLGGFHLSSAEKNKIENIIKDFKKLEVEKAAPCHCSGKQTRQLFKQVYSKNYIENGVGKIIKIN